MKDFFKVKVKGVAQSCQIEEILSELSFEYFPAVFAELSFEMRLDMITHIFERAIVG
jgi:hypothetical protein